MMGYFRRKAKGYGDNEPELPAGIHSESVRYTLEQLRIATNNFSQGNKIEDWGGGFGGVFRGEIDCRPVTIRRFAVRSSAGDAEFTAEINTLSRIHHQNIISLVDFCFTEDERLLVYDFAENTSLAYHLDEPGRRERLDWRSRRKIALGTARALAYLHHDCEPGIIHRDVKPSKILLNSGFKAMVSGYEHALFYPDHATHLTTAIAGTLGYIDPYYMATGTITPKADVYSFGIVLCDLITGKRALSRLKEFQSKKKFFVKALKENIFEGIIDPCLPRDYDPKEITCMIACAVVSTFDSPRDRPTMKQIINVLEGHQTPDSFISQALLSPPFPSEIEEDAPWLSSDEDTEDIESHPFSADVNPTAAPLSSTNPLPSSPQEDLVAIDEDMKSLVLTSDTNPVPLSSEENIAFGFVKYSFQELKTATDNFSTHNVIGKGGFGTVYKGDLGYGLVAIKKLIAEDERGDEAFKIELNAINRVSHVNIISLLGYCIEGSSRLLVYELAANGSLADHLTPGQRSNLDWETRKKIVLGTARALEYLHDSCKPRMVHRDIKPENVLLNSRFEAKLADLGIAKLHPTSFATHLSTKIKGTPGYIDPHYCYSGILTHKSDVYSFGILMLVSISGFTPSGELEEAKGKIERALRSKNYNDVADKRLNNVYDLDGMQRMLACAAVSTLPSPDDRPTMEEVHFPTTYLLLIIVLMACLWTNAKLHK